MNVEILNNKFGKPIPDSNHHVVFVGFKITNAVEVNPSFEVSLDGNIWYPFNVNRGYDFCGYIPQLTLTHGNYNIYVREVGHATVSFMGYEVELDLSSQGYFPSGETPRIITNNISAGNNQSLAIKTKKPNSVVRVYSTIFKNGQETFGDLVVYEPIVIGKSDANGDFITVLNNVRPNQRFCASAQAEYEFESLCDNTITVNNTTPKKAQLDIFHNIVSNISGGKKVEFSVSKGGIAYTDFSISKHNYNFSPVKTIDLDFGRQSVYIKDNNNGNVFSTTVHVVPQAQQQIIDINLRNDFSTTSNPNGNWEYGLIDSAGNYVKFDEYGNHDGKQSWAKQGSIFPLVGFGDNQHPTAGDAILLHPGSNTDYNTNSYGTGDSQAVAKYTFSNGGVFNTTKALVKKVAASNNPYSPVNPNGTTYIKYIIKLNNTVLKEGILYNENQEADFNLTQIAVTNGDVLWIIADAATDADGISPDFDHLHVSLNGQLVTNNITSPTAPNAPTTTGATTINSSTDLILKTSPNSEWIEVYKNGFFRYFTKTTLANTEYLNILDVVESSYSFYSLKNGVKSTGLDITVTDGLTPVPVVPTITSSLTTSPNTAISLTANTNSNIIVYKDGVEITTIPNITTGQQFTYIPTSLGVYTFKSEVNGILSAASAAVTVANPTGLDCSIFIEGFVVGDFVGYEVKVFKFNGKTILANVGTDGTLAPRTADFLRVMNTNYSQYGECFDFNSPDPYTALTQSDLGAVAGYRWDVANDSVQTPILVPIQEDNLNTYRVFAKSSCEEKQVVFAQSSTSNNPTDISSVEYSNDGSIKLDVNGNEDVNGNLYYYRDFKLPQGSYHIFYKVVDSLNTPIKVETLIFD